ncbi:MAG: DinB family protein [Phycisphaerales bacterium]|nr:MAG: DinB family protein [Phycisphaerales bacterium]
MSYAEMILPEFDQEVATTRRVLERLPNDKLDWKPHPKSNTIGWNANHLTEIPGWVENILTEPGFDVAPVNGEPHATPTLSNRDAILELFDGNTIEARSAIQRFDNAKLNEPWSLYEAGAAVMTMPRGAVMRTFVLSHIVHHRAILTVYYRLNDIAVPAIYGPSADEQG